MDQIKSSIGSIRGTNADRVGIFLETIHLFIMGRFAPLPRSVDSYLTGTKCSDQLRAGAGQQLLDPCDVAYGYAGSRCDFGSNINPFCLRQI